MWIAKRQDFQDIMTIFLKGKLNGKLKGGTTKIEQYVSSDSNFGSLFESNLQKLLSYISFHLKMN